MYKLRFDDTAKFPQDPGVDEQMDPIDVEKARCQQAIPFTVLPFAIGIVLHPPDKA